LEGASVALRADCDVIALLEAGELPLRDAASTALAEAANETHKAPIVARVLRVPGLSDVTSSSAWFEEEWRTGRRVRSGCRSERVMVAKDQAAARALRCASIMVVAR
jgi:hypothetical protein